MKNLVSDLDELCKLLGRGDGYGRTIRPITQRLELSRVNQVDTTWPQRVYCRHTESGVPATATNP
jgi:hypothetical protein